MNRQSALGSGDAFPVNRARRGWRLLGSAALWVALVAVAFLIWPAKFGGFTSFVFVSGESMTPAYQPGDLLVAWKGEPRVGDVIVYAPDGFGGAQIVHRVIGGDAQAGWSVKGDHNTFTDPFTPKGAEVRGVVALHIPHMAAVMGVLLSPFLWIGLFLLAGAVLVWPARNDDNDNDNDDNDDNDSRDSVPEELPEWEPALIGGE